MDRVINRRDVLFVAVTFAIGIFVGALIADNTILKIILPIALFAVGIIFAIPCKKFWIGCLYFAMCLGIVAMTIDFAVSSAEHIEGRYDIEARVVSVDGSYCIAEDISIDGKGVKGKATFHTDNLKIGDLVSFNANVDTLNMDIFDTYSTSAFNDRVYYRFTAIENMTVVSGDLKFLERVRKRITAPMFKYMAEEDAGIAMSLFFGDKSRLNEVDAELIKGVGMSHVFAVSGLHVGFLTALIIFVMKKLRQSPKRIFVLTALALLAYGFLTGFSSGIKRAAIMGLIYLAAPLIKRKSDPVTALSAASIVILLTNPRELFDVGFIMSVSAVLGIILFQKPVCKLLCLNGKVQNKIYKYFADGLALTVSANIFLLPICFNVFNSFAVYMALSNLVILPLVTVSYVMVALAAICTAVFPFLGFLYFPSKYPIIVIRLIAELIYSFPLAVISVPALGAATACYVAGGLFVSRLNKLNYKIKLIVLAVLLLIGALLLLLV